MDLLSIRLFTNWTFVDFIILNQFFLDNNQFFRNTSEWVDKSSFESYRNEDKTYSDSTEEQALNEATVNS